MKNQKNPKGRGIKKGKVGDIFVKNFQKKYGDYSKEQFRAWLNK